MSAASDISDSVSWDVKAGLNAEYKDRLGLGISAGFGARSTPTLRPGFRSECASSSDGL